jgi:hypothetical protein
MDHLLGGTLHQNVKNFCCLGNVNSFQELALWAEHIDLSVRAVEMAYVDSALGVNV